MAEAVVLSENAIYERMVEAILDHRLAPGTKLVEERLASAFGVSRTRIRPVLVRLANEQIVTLTHNRGATVAEPDEQESREVFQVRRMIEPVLVECFMARATADDIAVLAECIALEEAARHAGQLRPAIRHSGNFHLHIAAVARHQTLGRILRKLVSRTSLILMAWGAPPAQEPAASCGCQEHRALLDAMRLGDVAMAQELMQRHLLQIESQLSFQPAPAGSTDLFDLFAAPFGVE